MRQLQEVMKPARTGLTRASVRVAARMKNVQPILLGAVVAAMSAFTPDTAEACSLMMLPRGVEQLPGPGELPPHPDSESYGPDSQAPGPVTLSDPQVTLVHNGCNGSGASCPDMDLLDLTVSATDDLATSEQLRYIAAFGSTAAEATNAEAEIIFSPEPMDASRVRAHLGQDGQRSGHWFSAGALCFTLAAVDPAGNVGPRSAPLCLNTVDDDADYVTVVRGNGCTGFGCTSTTATAAPLALGAAVTLLAFCRRRVRIRTTPGPEVL